MTPNEALLEFTSGDFRSPTWEKLLVYLEARREQMRDENDGDLNEKETARIRGRLMEVASLMDLARSAELLRQEQAE
jgi:hypothetical protein